MRYVLSLLMVGVVLLAGASMGLAEDAKTDKKADAPTPAQLRVQMHLAMAALIEARSAEKPDEAKIEKLADKVQGLRGKIWAQGTAPGWRAGQQCPWGVPRGGQKMGRGYGPGKGYGAQQGRGRAVGRAMGGQGRGMGRAVGGQGRGMGYGVGGQGRGMGRAVGGQGRGMAAGMGRGLGRQWGYVDKNQDGICDNVRPPVPAKSVQPEK